MLPSLGMVTVAFPCLGHRECSQFKSNAKRASKTPQTCLAAKSSGWCRGREGQDKKWAGTPPFLTCVGALQRTRFGHPGDNKRAATVGG